MNLRDRDVRNAIRDALESTNAFDGVYLQGHPEDRGERSGNLRAVAIEPAETAVSDSWDDREGALLMTSRITLTFLSRHEDPLVRDETAEQLLNLAANALNGQSLAGLTLPPRTRFQSWTWHRANAPERRIVAVFEYQYLVEGWSELDISE